MNGNASIEKQRLWKRFQKMEALPTKDQRAVIRLINSLPRWKHQCRARLGAPFHLRVTGKRLPPERDRRDAIRLICSLTGAAGAEAHA